jgi:Calcium binding
MAKRKKDPLREDRIQNEAIVDAHGPEDQALGWYYYLQNKICFPFQAKCIVAKAVSPLLGETVEVRRMAPEDACSGDMLVLITWHGRNVAVPLSQLTPPTPTNQPPRPLATGRHYWVAQGYLF